MKSQKHSRWVGIMVIVSFLMIMGWATSKSWAAEVKYPNKPIQVVICYQPGATDVAMRPVVEKLQEYFGQPIVFIYKPGAAGAIGASFVAKAKPDGYTLIGSSHGPIILAPLTKEGLDYALDDFVPICRIVKAPYILSVKADSRWKTLNELVEEAKKNPGKLSFGSAGVLSTPHITAYRFIKSAGIELNHIPVPGDTPAVTAVLGGHVDLTITSPSPAIPHIRSGALRPLAVFDKERLKEFPDIPTAPELGYPVVFPYTWYGFLAPKGIPEEMVNTLSKATEKIVKDHKNFLQDRLIKLALILEFLNTEEYTKEIKRDSEAMKEIVKDIMGAKK